MDPSNPLRSVAPTVEADVLHVLARTRASLTGAKVAELAGRSQTQTRTVLGRLVGAGVVTSSRHGNAYAYLLNRDHVLSDPLLALLDGVGEVERRVRAEIETWETSPVSVVGFGSFTRRDGDEDSDVDLLVVRADDTPEDEPVWSDQLHSLSRSVTAWAGNPTQLVELSAREVDEVVAASAPIVRSLRDDGVVLWGHDLVSALKLER